MPNVAIWLGINLETDVGLIRKSGRAIDEQFRPRNPNRKGKKNFALKQSLQLKSDHKQTNELMNERNFRAKFFHMNLINN